MTRRLLPLALFILPAVIAVGCATTTVSSHVERGLNFSDYRTFDWGGADALPIGDPRLDANPLFKDRFVGAVERGLAQRGVRLSDKKPDLLIHYHANVSRRLIADYPDSVDVYCASGNCTPALGNREVTTVILDIIDARTNRLVWRGWAQRRAADFLGDNDRMAKAIDESVEQMLLRLPPTL